MRIFSVEYSGLILQPLLNFILSTQTIDGKVLNSSYTRVLLDKIFKIYMLQRDSVCQSLELISNTELRYYKQTANKTKAKNTIFLKFQKIKNHINSVIDDYKKGSFFDEHQKEVIMKKLQANMIQLEDTLIKAILQDIEEVVL